VKFVVYSRPTVGPMWSLPWSRWAPSLFLVLGSPDRLKNVHAAAGRWGQGAGWDDVSFNAVRHLGGESAADDRTWGDVLGDNTKPDLMGQPIDGHPGITPSV
jgi:hypothetical protein